jgi:hypothetical protein
VTKQRQLWRGRDAIVWTPVAVNEKRKPIWVQVQPYLPDYSAAVIGTSVVLRLYGGGGQAPLRGFIGGIPFALTTISFSTREEAQAWVEANRTDVGYALKPPAPEA